MPVNMMDNKDLKWRYSAGTFSRAKELRINDGDDEYRYDISYLFTAVNKYEYHISVMKKTFVEINQLVE